MKRTLLIVAVAVSAVSAAAEPPIREPHSDNACNYQAQFYENKVMRVRVTKPGKPSEVLHMATLPYVGCQREMTIDAPIATGGAIIRFGGGDVAAILTVDAMGTVSPELRYAGGFGIAAGVTHLGWISGESARSSFTVPNATAYDLQAKQNRSLGDVSVEMSDRAPVSPSNP